MIYDHKLTAVSAAFRCETESHFGLRRPLPCGVDVVN